MLKPEILYNGEDFDLVRRVASNRAFFSLMMATVIIQVLTGAYFGALILKYLFLSGCALVDANYRLIDCSVPLIPLGFVFFLSVMMVKELSPILKGAIFVRRRKGRNSL